MDGVADGIEAGGGVLRDANFNCNNLDVRIAPGVVSVTDCVLAIQQLAIRSPAPGKQVEFPLSSPVLSPSDRAAVTALLYARAVEDKRPLGLCGGFDGGGRRARRVPPRA